LNEDRVNGLPTPPLAPQAWCRRVLTSLNQRQVAEREAGYLEMLLTYFIERDPTAEAFTGMLAQYIDDPRPGIAEAAALLQRSWQRGRTVTAPFPPLSEALRTIGGLLDDGNVRYAYLVVSRDGVRVLTFGGEPYQRNIDHAELQQEIAARTALRGQVPPCDQAEGVSREARLRVIGSLLEQETEQSYDLVMTPRALIIEGSEGYYRLFPDDELTALAVGAAAERRADDGS
jgi:hypothetical protein